MKSYNKDLKKAIRLLKKKDYPEVIRFLEPKIPIFLENSLFHNILGRAFFYTGDLGNAILYFKRSLQVDHTDQDVKIYLALCSLRKKDVTEALRILLNIRDTDPENRKSTKILTLVRKAISNDSLDTLIKSGKFIRLYPSNGLYIPRGILFFILLAFLSAVLYFTLPLISFPQKENKTVVRDESSELNLSSSLRSNPVQFDGTFLYMMSGKEIVDSYELALQFFQDFRDNLAMRELNRLLHSNASREIKEKSELLGSYVQEPDLTTFKDNFTYDEVIKDPFLYKNCYIIWRGRISDYTLTGGVIRFNLLAGYDSGHVLDGIVPVILDFPVSLNTDLPVEILAKIQINKDKSIFLEGVSIRSFIQETD